MQSIVSLGFQSDHGDFSVADRSSIAKAENFLNEANQLVEEYDLEKEV